MQQRHLPNIQHRHLLLIVLSLVINILLSWLLFPLVLSPSSDYPFSKLPEVLLWQVICTIGWPFSLLGALLSFPFGARVSNTTSLLLISMYPAMQVLLILAAISKTWRRVEFFLMHFFVALSFAIVWYYVLNGYNFMLG